MWQIYFMNLSESAHHFIILMVLYRFHRKDLLPTYKLACIFSRHYQLAFQKVFTSFFPTNSGQKCLLFRSVFDLAQWHCSILDRLIGGNSLALDCLAAVSFPLDWVAGQSYVHGGYLNLVCHRCCKCFLL